MAATATLLFPWSDVYSVNHVTIDSQHRKLIDLLNELHAAMIAGRGRTQIGKVLSSLVTYTDVHFKTEEDLMAQSHYPDFNPHLSEHQDFCATVLDFQSKFQRNEVGMTVEVMEFLKGWLINHIIGSDKRVGAYLKE